MHVPTVTDQMLDKCLEAASSPVAVLFFGGEAPDRTWLTSRRFERVAEDYDDKVIFLRISGDENPTPFLLWTSLYAGVEIVIFIRGKVAARLSGEFTTETIGRLLDAVIAQHWQ